MARFSIRWPRLDPSRPRPRPRPTDRYSHNDFGTPTRTQIVVRGCVCVCILVRCVYSFVHVATETESDQPLRGSVLHTYAKGKTMPGTNGAPIAPRVVYMVREGVVQLRSRSAVTSFGDERENLTAGPIESLMVIRSTSNNRAAPLVRERSFTRLRKLGCCKLDVARLAKVRLA